MASSVNCRARCAARSDGLLGDQDEGLELDAAQPLGREAGEQPPLLQPAEDQRQLRGQAHGREAGAQRLQPVGRSKDRRQRQGVGQGPHHQQHAGQGGAAGPGVQLLPGPRRPLRPGESLGDGRVAGEELHIPVGADELVGGIDVAIEDFHSRPRDLIVRCSTYSRHRQVVRRSGHERDNWQDNCKFHALVAPAAQAAKGAPEHPGRAVRRRRLLRLRLLRLADRHADHRRAGRPRGCATPASTPPPCARPRGRRC